MKFIKTQKEQGIRLPCVYIYIYITMEGRKKAQIKTAEI